MLFLSDLDQTGNNNMTNNDVILQYFIWHGKFCLETAKLSRITIKNSTIFRNSSSPLRVWKETFNK